MTREYTDRLPTRQPQDEQRERQRDEEGLDVYPRRLAAHLRQFVRVFDGLNPVA